jgi:K+-transporting ATPase ATPase C chain
MLTVLRRSIAVSIVLFVVCGIAYPLIVTGIGQVAFRDQANGSLMTKNGAVIGSSLIGQHWSGPKWFQGRPDGDDPMASGSQNFGPKSKLLLTFSEQQRRALVREGIKPTNDLVTGSGSGIDPDISPADAYAQVAAVAKANGLSAQVVHHLVESQTHSRQWGFLGAPYVDVLQLNLALQALEHRR